MIAKGELVLAPVQQQDLAFLMQSGTQAVSYTHLDVYKRQTGSALPALSKTNDDLSTFLDTSDEWISQRTGIRQRSLCSDETLTDLLTVAAKQALERAGVEPQQLDLILCATIRGEYITPSQACVIQQKLGAGLSLIHI